MFKSIINTISSAWNSKESKQIRMSFDEAKNRLTDIEYNRLTEAFSRVASHNSYITKQVFCRDVLGELFPIKISECIYGACGGTNRGITFKDLVIALVFITKGKTEEKIQFIFSLYLHGDNTAIRREDLVKFTEEVEGLRIAESVLNRLFHYKGSIEFDEFHYWIADNPNFTSISAWLLGDSECAFKLTDDHETPTFYQTLAGVTHLEEEDIIELEKKYWILQGKSVNGRINVDTLRPLISPPLPESVVQGFLDAFDENRDGHIDFKEMACGISAAARGPTLERQKFCFKIFDQDKDGLLSRENVLHMVQVMKGVVRENMSDPPSIENLRIVDKKDEDTVHEIFERVKGDKMTLVEYLEFSLHSQLPEQLLTLIYQICQIVFGLRPLTPAEELEVVTAWLSRADKRERYVGQVFYIVSMEWWLSWLSYVNPGPSSVSHSDSGLGSILGGLGSQSNSISNITETVASNGSSSKNSSRCWSRKGNVEVASADNQNVVITGLVPIIHDVESPVMFSPNSKSSASSLSLVTIDSSRSSNTPSPVNSPECSRRQLTSSSLNSLGRGQIPRRRRPDAIDNSCLISPNTSNLFQRTPSLTLEGGRLRKDIEEDRDFKVIPQSLWSALQQWYGAVTAIPRQVIEYDGQHKLELYPITVLLYRHQQSNGRSPAPSNAPWSGMAGIYGSAALSTTMSYVQSHNLNFPKRALAYTASFSTTATLGYVLNFICSNLRVPIQDTRLDLLTNDDLSFAVVLEEEDQTLDELGVGDLANVLIEIRNKDQTWPEEIVSFASSAEQHRLKRNQSIGITSAGEEGLTGLNNLGNTCFMNSSIQCASNTIPLTLYFRKRMHMFELNRANPMGMKGHIAKRYGDLIMDVWSGTTKTIAPFKLRYTIGKYAPRFSGFQQNDAQELLAFLLDGLHEDLNRVAEKPYVELKDSDNRPDIICAQEAWENHLLRNKSVIVDLFHGQLKSSVRCKECRHESVRFDPFNYLSLPLPMESFIYCELIVIRQCGALPTRYGILSCVDENILDMKIQLSKLTGENGSLQIHPENFIFAIILNFRIQQILNDEDKIKTTFNARVIYAFQVGGHSDGEMRSLSSSPCPTEHQIQRLLASNKYNSQGGSGLRNENGFGAGHSRQSSISSCGSSITQSSSTSSTESGTTGGPSTPTSEQQIVVIHRKMIRQETYFISIQKSRPALFGLPLIIPYQDGMTHLDLYRRVWALVARLVSALPPEGPNLYNHAQDCDDSLGYEYPFVLRLVKRDAEWCCGKCNWYRMCRGCTIVCCEQIRLDRIDSTICSVAIDWDPTALHLRYQVMQESDDVRHTSLASSLLRQTESVELATCLDNFTKEEELTEDEKYYCAKCGSHQLALKKLQIWRLPPFLIVHLKRFQAFNNRWIKSHKLVNFPFYDFDPTAYLADVPRRTVDAAGATHLNGDLDKETEMEVDLDCGDGGLYPLQDFHQHRLLPAADVFKLNYRLYAIVCHTGIMGGGHYFAYARSPRGKWHCFNDSSCKEVHDDQIDKGSAYMLFYERIGIDNEAYMPRIDPKAIPLVSDEELEAEENDFKKFCVI